MTLSAILRHLQSVRPAPLAPEPVLRLVLAGDVDGAPDDLSAALDGLQAQAAGVQRVLLALDDLPSALEPRGHVL